MCLPIKTYPLRQVFQLGTLTASTKLVFKPPFGTKILAMALQGGAAFSADNTNYVAMGAINKGIGGSGSAVIVDISDAANSTKSSGGSAVVAFTPNQLTVLTASGVNKLIKDESVEITITIAATVSIADSVFFVDYLDPRRA